MPSCVLKSLLLKAKNHITNEHVSACKMPEMAIQPGITSYHSGLNEAAIRCFVKMSYDFSLVQSVSIEKVADWNPVWKRAVNMTVSAVKIGILNGRVPVSGFCIFCIQSPFFFGPQLSFHNVSLFKKKALQKKLHQKKKDTFFVCTLLKMQAEDPIWL